MEVLILVVVLVILLIAWAVLNRINWFGLLNFERKYVDDQAWAEEYINDDMGYNANAKIKRAEGELSVINDGYGSNDSPYEIWEQSNGQLYRKSQGATIPYDEYEDVEGWLTEEDVAKKVRKWF